MTFKEIVARLKNEGITPEKFSGQLFASMNELRPRAIHVDVDWLGEVHLVQRKPGVEGPDTLAMTYHLPAHSVYLQTFGTCKWAPAEKDFEPAADDYQQALIAWYEAHPNRDFAWEYMDHFSPVKPVTKTVVEYQYWPADATEAEIAYMKADLTDQCDSCDLCQRPPEIQQTSAGELKANPSVGHYTVMCPQCTQYVIGENVTAQAAPRTEDEHRQAMQDAVQSWNQKTVA